MKEKEFYTGETWEDFERQKFIEAGLDPDEVYKKINVVPLTPEEKKHLCVKTHPSLYRSFYFFWFNCLRYKFMHNIYRPPFKVRMGAYTWRTLDISFAKIYAFKNK